MEANTSNRPLDHLREQVAQLLEENHNLRLIKQNQQLQIRKLETLHQQLETQREALIVDKIDLRSALEELKAAQEELIETNERLRLANQEIDQQKEELIIRGIELRTALEELRASQEELLRSEKMSALGSVISNIAHEINTPIGAIYAASQNVYRSLPTLLDTFPELFKEMPLELKPLFFELIEKSKSANGIEHDTRTERKIRQQIQDRLEQVRAPQASELARTFAKMGLSAQDVDIYLTIIRSPFGERLFPSSLAVGRLKSNIETIVTAVQKTQKVILALKSYLDEDITPQRGGTIDLVQNVDLVVEQYRALHTTGIQFLTDYPDQLPPVTCYPDQLSQVWNHLLLNATQALQAQAGGGNVHIRVEKVPDRDAVQVRIQDSGPGIPARIMDKIFDAFFTTRSEGEGSGLGLYVSRKIIHRHKGTLEATSQPGCTVFATTIPFRI